MNPQRRARVLKVEEEKKKKRTNLTEEFNKINGLRNGVNKLEAIKKDVFDMYSQIPMDSPHKKELADALTNIHKDLTKVSNGLKDLEKKYKR